MRPYRRAALVALALAAAGCGGGAARRPVPTVAPAREFTLDWQGPKTLAKPGTTTLRFAVRTPDGKILTRFRTGAGPHTGVHVIIVRDDLSTIVHKHPPIPASGRLALPVTLARAGRYHVLVDVYPAASGGPRNFQLTHELQVGAGDVRAPAARLRSGGQGRRADVPGREAADPAARPARDDGRHVTDAAGKPVTFTPFYGALAHAIFFRAGSLDYFHSHICGNDPACSAGFGTPATTGHSTKPGRLELGVLLPATGRWRLFLQVTRGGKLITAPFTLRVR